MTGYFINRLGDHSRLDSMLAQSEMLAYNNLDLLPFTAITKDDLPRFKPWFKGRWLNCPWLSSQPGTMGCATSHVCLWMHILARHREPVLIVEDDVKIKPEFFDAWTKGLGELPNDWGVVFFGQWDDNSNKKDHSHTWKRIVNGSTRGGGTHAYIVNPSRIAELIEYMLPFYQEIDKSFKEAHAAFPLFCDRSELVSLKNEIASVSVRTDSA